MPIGRRQAFLGLVGGAAAFGCATRPGESLPDVRPPEARGAVDDEAYWARVRACYDLPDTHVNLENGYFSVCAIPVLRATRERELHVNRRGAHYMRTEQKGAHEAVRVRLAAFAGVDAGEVALVRNTTEALNVVLHGIDWKAGDELVMSNQDYPSMVGIMKRLEQRRGVVLRVVDLPLDPRNDEEVVSTFMRAVGPKTRAALVTQVVHLTGHVLPVAALSARLRKKGVTSIVDGAHAFAHLDFRIADLGCDFFAASLHKWLGAPLGNGILWMRRERIPTIEPLFTDLDFAETDIRRFEHVGTRPMQDLEAIAFAIDFHEQIGGAEKQARLIWLRQRFVAGVREIPGTRLYSPTADARACAISTVGLEGLPPEALAAELWARKIHVVAIVHDVVNGVRVTPHVYTSADEIDRAVAAIRAIVAGA